MSYPQYPIAENYPIAEKYQSIALRRVNRLLQTNSDVSRFSDARY